jgi:hypothetical protein
MAKCSFLIRYSLIAVFVVTTCGFDARALTGQEAIAQLKEIQSANRETLQKLDKAVQEQLQKSREITAKDLARTDHDIKFRAIEDSIISLQEKRKEYIKRDDFLNQLVAKFASNYHGQNLKEYLEQNLLELATTELGVGTREINSDQDYWRFLTYASVVVREMPEQIENLLKFLESYMNFSTISNPKAPGEFRAQRNYFNSRSTESGKPVSADQIDE